MPQGVNAPDTDGVLPPHSGPNTGLFIRVVADDNADLEIPGKPYTFGTLKAAQAVGDLESLRGHGRRVGRVRLQTLLEREG